MDCMDRGEQLLFLNTCWSFVTRRRQYQMIQNKHVTPFLANTLTMLAVVVPPLCSSYFYLQQPPDGFIQVISNITVIEQLGLYQNIPSTFTDAAAGYIKASCERPSKRTRLMAHRFSDDLQLCTQSVPHPSSDSFREPPGARYKL